jgi:hypothetical protein
MSTPTPTQPCLHCSSTQFARVQKVRILVPSDGAHDAASCPDFSLLICVGCGQTNWFTDPKLAVFYLGARAERVDVPVGGPYR